MTNLKKASLVALVAVLAVVGYKVAGKSNDQTAAAAGATPPADTTTGAVTPAVSATPSAATTGSKQISATQTYRDPSGEEQVTFMLTVDSTGIITDAASTILAENPIAVRRQTAFHDGFAAAVKSKKLADITSINVVSGSSLTTGAFNAALASLKSQI